MHREETPTGPATSADDVALRPGTVTERLLPLAARRLAAWCLVLLLAAGVAAVALWICVYLKAAIIPILLAVLGTALLAPLHHALLRLRLHPSLAAGLTCAALVAVVGGVGYVVASALLQSGDQILDSAREAAQRLDHLNIAGTSAKDLGGNLRKFGSRFAGTAASGLLTGISLVTQAIAAGVLALLLTFFFLRDAARVPALLRAMAPGATGPRVEAMARRAYRAVEGFVRGTTLIALIDAVFITAGLLILRVPGAFGLGALVFVGAYIPYLGAFVSGALAVLVALADRGLAIAVWALAVVLVVELLEGHVLQPVIQSRTVRMHPAVVLVTLTAGASVAGIIGMLLALPLTAAAFGVIAELRRPGAGGQRGGAPGGDGAIGDGATSGAAETPDDSRGAPGDERGAEHESGS